jgi:hypothetical protein
MRSMVEGATRYSLVSFANTAYWPDGQKSMVDLTDAEFEAAAARGALARAAEPRASSARYDG